MHILCRSYLFTQFLLAYFLSALIYLFAHSLVALLNQFTFQYLPTLYLVINGSSLFIVQSSWVSYLQCFVTYFPSRLQSWRLQPTELGLGAALVEAALGALGVAAALVVVADSVAGGLVTIRDSQGLAACRGLAATMVTTPLFLASSPGSVLLGYLDPARWSGEHSGGSARFMLLVGYGLQAYGMIRFQEQNVYQLAG